MQVTSSFQQTTNPSGKRIFLDTFKADVQDTAPNSTYFNISELTDVLTSGKNCIAINGSDSLLLNSQILVEVLDLNGNALYTEVATGPSQYRSGMAILVSIWIYNTTPVGLGQINIVGTLKTKQTVKWTKVISINPILQNFTKTRFYNQPTFKVTPNISKTLYFSGSFISSASGIVNGGAILPQANSDYSKFDTLRNVTDYRLYYSGGDKFSSSMNGQPITITNIIAPDGSTFINQNIISNVINDTTINLQYPVYYLLNNSVKNVVNFVSASYSLTYLNPPTASISQEFGPISVQYLRSIAEIKIANVDTFSGNVYRFRIYRKSLNSAFDSECIADEIFQSREEFIDISFPDRFRDKIGYFLNQNHITGDPNTLFERGYWRVNSLITGSSVPHLVYDSSYIVDGMYISGSNITPNTSSEKRFVVKSYDNNSPLGTGDISSGIFPVNTLLLEQNVQYVLSFNMVGFKNSFPNQPGKVDFYLVDEISGSTQDISVSSNFDGYGIKIGSVDFEAGAVYSNFQNQQFLFTLNQPIGAQLHIVPYYGDYIISQISVKAYQAFSFSPQIININVPFSVDVANEAFQITAELFDVNCGQIPTPTLTTITSFDPAGQTVYNRQSEESQVPQSSSITAGYASTASNATYADNAGFAAAANISNTASLSFIAVHSVTSDNATNATNAVNSAFANVAGSATTATFASSANTANSATTAGSATTADTANYATLAGNVIYSGTWSDTNLFSIGGVYFWVSGSTIRLNYTRPSHISDGASLLTGP